MVASPIIDDLLEDAVEVLGRKRQRKPVFNPASLLLNRELDLSRLIAWMLNPRGTHGECHKFLSLFLERLGFSDINHVIRARVKPEFTLLGKDGASFGRIDIQVLHDDFLILIENKPTSGLRPDQLRSYKNWLDQDKRAKKAVVFLPGLQWSSSKLDVFRQQDIKVFTLGGEFQEWVRSCREIVQNPSVKAFIGSFHDHLGERYAGWGSSSMTDLVDVMMSTAKNIHAAMSIIAVEDLFLERLSKRFAHLVEKHARKAGLTSPVPIDGSILFGKEDYNSLSLDIGDPRLYFSIEALPGFSSFIIGVCTRTQTQGLDKDYANETALLKTTFGSSENREPYDWWLWQISDLTLDGGAGRTDNNFLLLKWAADETDDGLAACFVQYAGNAEKALKARQA